MRQTKNQFNLVLVTQWEIGLLIVSHFEFEFCFGYDWTDVFTTEDINDV